jgi:hypothetical protein
MRIIGPQLPNKTHTRPEMFPGRDRVYLIKSDQADDLSQLLFTEEFPETILRSGGPGTRLEKSASHDRIVLQYILKCTIYQRVLRGEGIIQQSRRAVFARQQHSCTRVTGIDRPHLILHQCP